MDCDLCGLPIVGSSFLMTPVAGGGTGWRHTHHVTVDALTDEHRDRVWFDRDGDVWATMTDSDAWACWPPGEHEAQAYMRPDATYGPFTEVRRAT